MLKSTLFDIYRFIIRPHQTEIVKLTWKENLKTYLSILVLKFLFSIVVLSLVEVLIDTKIYRRPDSDFLSSFPLKLILIGVLIPIFEEFTFRLYLKFSPIHIAVSSFLVFYFVVTTFYFKVNYVDITETSFLLRIVLSALVGIMLYLFAKKYLIAFQTFWSNHFRWIFFASALFFGLLHVTNFNIQFQELYLVPLLVSTHIISGLVFGYARIKHGMALAIAVHITNNLIGVIFSG